MCLYSGISNQIETARLFLNDEYILKRMLEQIAEAMEFYKEHCILSHKSLELKFDELMKLIQEREGSASVDPQPAE